jgi:hypothetical protein
MRLEQEPTRRTGGSVCRSRAQNSGEDQGRQTVLEKPDAPLTELLAVESPRVCVSLAPITANGLSPRELCRRRGRRHVYERYGSRTRWGHGGRWREEERMVDRCHAESLA